MKRRDILSLLGAAASVRPLAALAQQPAGNVRRIGLLTSGPMRSDAEFRQTAWVLALRDLGWIVGTTIAFERRASDGRSDLLPALALNHRLPGVFSLRQYAEAGGLLSYGPDLPALERQHARYVDRILRGANPAELPIEQPTKFDLVINLKTASALGLTIPQLLLQRADEVIE